jgi:uracil-DNA glycosylase family 4
MTEQADTQRQRTLEQFQTRIRACTACLQAGYIDRAMPIFQGNAHHRIMIIGQAPAYRTVETPPYSGASGKKLQSWLEQAGFPPGSLYERFYLTSLTKCFPGPSKNGSGDRPPSAAEIALCGPHLQGELDLVQPELIITLGRMSAARFLGSKPLVALVGQVFEHDGRLILPLPHPSGVSRWLNNPANQQLVDQALAELSRVRVELEL